MAHAFVSASHVDGRWRLDHARVKLTNNGAGWAAHIPAFGMGKQYPQPEEAIRDVVMANGCTKVVIHSVVLEAGEG